MRSAIVMRLRLWRSANVATSGPRITVPLSFMSSASTPTAGKPASRQRSTQASVWPERISTPPFLATSGKTWPGRTKSEAPLLPLASARTVLVRSSAEIPVVTPCRTSTETVKAVPSGASLSATIGSRWRRLACSTASGAHTIPDVLRMMKAIFSGVHIAAATNRSPSFSRSSSSATTTISPRAKAAMTASTSWWPGDVIPSVPIVSLIASSIPSRASRPAAMALYKRVGQMNRGDQAHATLLFARPDTRFADHLRPLRRLGLDDGGKRLGRAADQVEPELVQTLADVRHGQDLRGLAVKLVDDRARRA